MKVLFAVTVFTVALSAVLCDSHWITDDFVKTVNSKATTWTARKNFQNYTAQDLKALAGVIGLHPDPSFKFPTKTHEVKDDLPDYFDSRDVWPQCDSIRSIRNQGGCGGCWAFAAVEVMSDRLCVFTGGQTQFTFSPEELISCCSACGNGCQGGFLLPPFEYWQNNGIPSGGDEGTNFGCRPYTAASTGQTPECNERCVLGYPKQWTEDVRHGVAAYHVTNTVDQIQHEIMINGPVETMFEVYEDFYSYGSGVYQYTYGNFVGYHALKILGWGTENGVPYWIVANSWGNGWGENGFFKMLRGYNNCIIESEITAGIPNTAE